jgi:hypothetical protein
MYVLSRPKGSPCFGSIVVSGSKRAAARLLHTQKHPATICHVEEYSARSRATCLFERSGRVRPSTRGRRHRESRFWRRRFSTQPRYNLTLGASGPVFEPFKQVECWPARSSGWLGGVGVLTWTATIGVHSTRTKTVSVNRSPPHTACFADEPGPCRTAVAAVR